MNPRFRRKQRSGPTRSRKNRPDCHQKLQNRRGFSRFLVGYRDGLIVESEDRCVRVHNRVKSTLLLLRLANALAEIEGIDGLRTHSSWWVARNAVTEVLQRDRAISLPPVNGIEVSVARNAVAE
jgi:DNA-binding LytR/AlgR family response regulator